MVTRLKTFDPSDEQAFKKRKPKAVVAPKQKFDSGISISFALQPKTEAQRQFVRAWIESPNIVAFGSPGTGKTFLATYLALDDLFKRKTSKIVFIRSSVQIRQIGALPGTVDQKMEEFTIPYKQLVTEITGNGTAWSSLQKSGHVEFCSTSFIRGMTFRDSIIIVDEFSNCNWHELNSLATRLNEDSRLILCGDIAQSDIENLREKSGYNQFMKVARSLPDWFEMVQFLPQDIVRSKFVKDWIIAAEDVVLVTK